MTDGPKTHTVKLMKDVVLDTPELWLEVFVEGDRSEQVAFANWLSRASCKRADAPDVADLVIFTGGDDVNPALYGASRHPQTFMDSDRDAREIELYHFCLEQGIPMMGICRGAQFLHVMNGGVLYQDVDNHNSQHAIFDIVKQRTISPVSSVHHQMCKFNPGGRQQIIADAINATERWLDADTVIEGRMADIEAYFYRETVCLGFQGHPEYRGYAHYSQWCLENMMEYLVMNPDLSIPQGQRFRRVKPELLEERKMRIANNEPLEEIPDAEVD
jgi:gamma-glutamyl-gamma-aminobutyrate hydrolase PuuD